MWRSTDCPLTLSAPFTVGVVLVFALVVCTRSPANALKCYCTTSKGAAECEDGSCELFEEVDAIRPACAALNHSVTGVHYACVRSKMETDETTCKVSPTKNGGTVTACWCRDTDFCNENLFSRTLMETAPQSNDFHPDHSSVEPHVQPDHSPVPTSITSSITSTTSSTTSSTTTTTISTTPTITTTKATTTTPTTTTSRATTLSTTESSPATTSSSAAQTTTWTSWKASSIDESRALPDGVSSEIGDKRIKTVYPTQVKTVTQSVPRAIDESTLTSANPLSSIIGDGVDSRAHRDGSYGHGVNSRVDADHTKDMTDTSKDMAAGRSGGGRYLNASARALIGHSLLLLALLLSVLPVLL